MTTYKGNPPTATFLLRLLTQLLAEQEGVDIEYSIEENGKVVYDGSTKDNVFLGGVKDGKQQKTCASR